ncbi:MAG: anthranilate/aminodeoxychorismate synthase component II [Myxococcales bacterium]|nr:anthranilate/aminodeoxychorismate synthase component II [Myxococcales bacterium]
MILVLDNYDSFTFNLVQMLQVRGQQVDVRHHDEAGLLQCHPSDYSALVVGPGPGRPEEAGNCFDLLKAFLGQVPVLGVCLGHQAIGMMMGGELGLAPEPMHGRVVPIFHEAEGIFKGIPSPFAATRYHSLVIHRESLPAELKVTAWTEDGTVMGLEHPGLGAHGVQFHPESIASAEGGPLIDNFLECTR